MTARASSGSGVHLRSTDADPELRSHSPKIGEGHPFAWTDRLEPFQEGPGRSRDRGSEDLGTRNLDFRQSGLQIVGRHNHPPATLRTHRERAAEEAEQLVARLEAELGNLSCRVAVLLQRFAQQDGPRNRQLREHQPAPAQDPRTPAVLLVAQHAGLGIEDLLPERGGDPQPGMTALGVADDHGVTRETLDHGLDHSGPAPIIRQMPLALFWVAFLGFAGFHLVRTAMAVQERDPAKLADLGQDFVIRDFEGFWRCALRMQKGEIMYFPHTGERLEMPSKHGPFFELLMRPFLPLGSAWAEIVFSALSLGLLAATLPLARRLLERATNAPIPSWTPWAALLGLIPFVHLAAAYSQTVFAMVFLLVVGLLAFEKRPFLAGLVFALPAAIKLMPIVLLPWLVWRRSWRAALGMTVGLVGTTGAVLLDQGLELGKRQGQAYVHMLQVDPVYETYHERFQSLAPLVLGTITPRYETDLASSTQKRSWEGKRNFLASAQLWEHARAI